MFSVKNEKKLSKNNNDRPVLSRLGSDASSFSKPKLFRSNNLFKPPVVYRSVSSAMPRVRSRGEETKLLTLSSLKNQMFPSQGKRFSPRELSASAFNSLRSGNYFTLVNKQETLSAIHDKVQTLVDIVNDNSYLCEWSGRAYLDCKRIEVAINVYRNTEKSTLVVESKKIGGDSNAHYLWTNKLKESLKRWSAFQPKTFDLFRTSLPAQLPKQTLQVSDDSLKRHLDMLACPFSDTQENSLYVLAEAAESHENCRKICNDDDIIQSLTDKLESNDAEILRLSVSIFSRVTEDPESARMLRNSALIIQRLYSCVQSVSLERETRRQSARALSNISSNLKNKALFNVGIGGEAEILNMKKMCEGCSDPVIVASLKSCLN